MRGRLRLLPHASADIKFKVRVCENETALRSAGVDDNFNPGNYRKSLLSLSCRVQGLSLLPERDSRRYPGTVATQSVPSNRNLETSVSRSQPNEYQ